MLAAKSPMTEGSEQNLLGACSVSTATTHWQKRDAHPHRHQLPCSLARSGSFLACESTFGSQGSSRTPCLRIGVEDGGDVGDDGLPRPG